ncbi:hypothetical protein B0H12DRAFT_1067433 [Mycena haematopus]|nr:hypothetical protein B0H12DRAFT_1067433 [Mycena haematopus]
MNPKIPGLGHKKEILVEPKLNCRNNRAKAELNGAVTSVTNIHDKHSKSVSLSMAFFLRKEIPPQVQSNFALLDGWAQKAILALGYDMKHTQRWDCETCGDGDPKRRPGQPARETWFDPRPSLRPSEPVVVLHTDLPKIHHLCEAGGGPCHTAVEDRARELAIEAGGMLPPPSLYLPNTSESAIPLASGCVKCQRDETGAPGAPISRCSRCRSRQFYPRIFVLRNHASAECQTEDWSRHGKICKTIKEVKWVHWEDNTTEEPEVPLRMPGAYP